MIRETRKYHGDLRLPRRPSCFFQKCVRRIAPVIAAGRIDGIRQKIQWLRQPCGVDVAGTGSLIAQILCHRTNNGDFRALLQGQDTALVFQQHSALLRRTLGKGMVGFIITGCFFLQRFRRPEHQLQHAAGAVIYAVYGECAILDRLQGLFFHVIAAAGHIQVTARPEALDAVVHRAPVGHDHAVKAPFGAENICEQSLVVRTVDAVQPRVGAHHRGKLALLDGNLKGRQIQLPQRAVIQHRVRGEAAFFLRIYGEVLETGADALRFCAPDEARRQLARQIRILAEIFKVPSAERVALEIGAGAENKTNALLFGLLADGGTDLL